MTDSGVGEGLEPGAAEFESSMRVTRRSVGFAIRVTASVVAVLTVLTVGWQMSERSVALGSARANGLPVFVHYLPWYSTPKTLGAGKWGWHWTMDKENPNVVASNGRRQIASHFSPSIGPYDSADPAVLKYQLLLMKYAGVNGVLIDWYGTAGTNSDLSTLQQNTDLLIAQVKAIGLKFALVYEDRFARGPTDVRTSLTYAKDHYFPLPQYVRLASTRKPYLGVFGPVSSVSTASWESIARAIGPVDLRTLWNNGAAGGAADGQFTWPYATGDGSDWDSRLQTYYGLNRAVGRRVTGVAYPGFDDFYAQGETNGKSLFRIPSNGVTTLQETLADAAGAKGVDSFQIATWNDYGEGTMIEPTVQYGFKPLAEVQRFTGAKYSVKDLQTVLHWYRAEVRADSPAIERAYRMLVSGRPAQARAQLESAG